MKRTVAVVITFTLLVAAACKRSEAPAPAGTGTAATTATPSGQPAAPAVAETTAAAGTDVGSKMPDYAATLLNGSAYPVSGKRDKVLLLNVWATWCGPCRYEIPELEQLHQKYAGKGLEVLGVSVDESGIDAVRQFVTENKMTYPVAIDPAGKITTILDTSVLPTSVIVDRSGKIVWKKFGAIMPNDPELQKAIDAAL